VKRKEHKRTRKNWNVILQSKLVKSDPRVWPLKLVHVQVQQQLEAQQAQHAAQMEDMSSKAAQMESLIRQATELDQQHVTELNARETDLDELRQVDHVYVQSQVCVHACVCVGVCPVSNLLSTKASSTESQSRMSQV